MFGLFKRGFGKGGNTLIALLIFFMIGLLLHFRGNTQPVVMLWQQLKAAVYAPGEAELFVSHVAVPSSETHPDGTDELAAAIARPGFHVPAAASNLQIVHHQGFSLGYAERYEQAAWVAYPLVREQVTGQSMREKLFLPDPKVRTGSAVFADYTRSGYDRGHLAPAADFRSVPQEMKETFYMSNISPQNRDFNAGIWNDLERMVRVWAQHYGQVYVITGPVLKPGLKTIGRINKIAVPEQFYKVVLYVKPPHAKGIAFLMDNQPANTPLSQYVVSIDTVETLTGLDFFTLLPDAVEDKIEAKSNAKEWYRLK